MCTAQCPMKPNILLKFELDRLTLTPVRGRRKSDSRTDTHTHGRIVQNHFSLRFEGCTSQIRSYLEVDFFARCQYFHWHGSKIHCFYGLCPRDRGKRALWAGKRYIRVLLYYYYYYTIIIICGNSTFSTFFSLWIFLKGTVHWRRRVVSGARMLFRVAKFIRLLGNLTGIQFLRFI